MHYLQRAARCANWNVFKRSEEPRMDEPPEEMSKFDGYLNFICKIVSWEDPSLTWISFIIVNLIFSSIVYYETKFYCVLFTSAALLVCLDYYGDGIDFKRVRRYIYFRDITDVCSKFGHGMNAWKRDNPSFFCGATTTFFLVLSFIGRTIPIRVLLYFLLLALYFGPTVIKLAPQQVRDVCLQFINTLRATDIAGENDFIPAVNNDMDLDVNNDGDSVKTEKTQDSLTVFTTGISSMPSHLDGDDGTDLEVDDLVPMSIGRPMDTSSESDDEHQGIYFDSGHFMRSSSSSDEEQYSKGLQADTVDRAGSNVLSQLGAGMVSSLAAAGSNFLSNLHANFGSPAPAEGENGVQLKRSDSSDSDFEIINSEDVRGEHAAQ